MDLRESLRDNGGEFRRNSNYCYLKHLIRKQKDLRKSDRRMRKFESYLAVCCQNKAKKRDYLRPTLFLFLILAFISTLESQNSFQAEAIKLQPEGKEKFYWSGEQFVITCQNNNNIKNVKIRWLGPNGLDITEDRSQRVHAESSGPHGHRLVVMNATVGVDDGNYKCTLGSTGDMNPREIIDFTLKLHKTTSFKDTARHLVLATGQQGVLICRVEFDPNVLSASVSWVRDQKPIEMFNDSSYSVTEYDSNRQLSQLIISPLTKNHDGTYTCRAAAVTSNLSKISDHDIQLETNYAPTFDKDTHTVWVERSSPSGSSGRSHPQANVYARPAHPHQSARGRHNKQHYPAASSPNRRPPADNQPELEEGVAAATSGNGSAQIVRVELRCTSQANPKASILWSSTQNAMFILAKGEPAHVLEEPRVELDGHNTTSILVIGYNLDLDWKYKSDSYICSASNKIGKASKTFTIEQGDPPPSFNVGPIKQYNAQNSLFKFTLLGPNFEQADSGVEPEIVPPVDSFRIRAENPLLTGANGLQDNPRLTQQQSYWSNARKQNEPSVQWTLSNNNPAPESNLRFNQPQNVTVNLGRLPSGNQKLFLEAHNAVGWSPNATYLGDYYIVSGSTSNLFASNKLTIAICLLIMATFATDRQRSL